MKVSVVIPTYRRAQSLQRCLEGLRRQVRLPDEVLVIARSDDEDTLHMLSGWQHWDALKIIQHSEGGAVGQYNRGLEASQGDIVAITDDDSVPRPEWLLRIERHFLDDASLGGVGGPDYVVENGIPLRGDAQLVGVVQWFGRIVGNHHLGSKVNAKVDVLKGVNMAFRAAAIAQVRFDTQLRGEGAQTSLDLAFSLAVQKKGWDLIYDSAVAVDHYPARRFDDNQRATPSMKAIEDSSFNHYLTIRRHMKDGFRRRMAILWAWAIGTKRIPGVVRGLAAAAKGDRAGRDMRKASKEAWSAAKRVSAGASSG